MTKVLEGVRVVELSTIITAPLAGMMLADLGADVLKVEPPGGDPFRNFRGDVLQPEFHRLQSRQEEHARSTCAPMRAARCCSSWSRAPTSCLENYRAGVMERLGVGWRCAARPRIRG